MYRCQICNIVVPPNTPCTRLVVETREKEYPSRGDRGGRNKSGGRNNPRYNSVSDVGGKGTEIVREVVACPTCARKRKAEESAEAGTPATA